MKTKDFCRIIESVGFVLVRSSDHIVYSNGQRNVAVPHQKEINRMMARRLLKEIGYKAAVPELNYGGM